MTSVFLEKPSLSGRPNIVLAGFMGSGKTTVGRLLADRLQCSFVDMDALIEEREGRTISDIFAVDGEPYFRSVERSLVRELSARQGLVIATGGGVVADAENVRDFERTGLLVCLDATPEQIMQRIAHETHRPLLAAPDREQRIRDLLNQRRAAYASVSFHVDTNGRTPAEVVERILEELEERVRDSSIS